MRVTTLYSGHTVSRPVVVSSKSLYSYTALYCLYSLYSYTASTLYSTLHPASAGGAVGPPGP